MTDSESLQIETPSGAALIACAGFLYDQVPLAERAKLVTELLRLHGAKRAVVVSAQISQRLTAAITAQIVPGRQAFVQPPKMVSTTNDNTIKQLFRGLESELVGRGVDYIQAILPGEADGALLEHVGMKPIAKLSFLGADIDETSAEFESPLAFEPFEESQRTRMRELIGATYEDSDDCPEVDGMRDMDDVIDGYEGAGKFEPGNWFFVRKDDRDIGCLLLADHPNTGQFELVYMGLLVDERGSGLGVTLTNFAKSRTAAANRNRIHVAVDSANAPAIQTYMRCGFHLIQEQQVLAKSLIQPDAT